MALLPNKAKLYFSEQDVNIPGLDRPNSAYDLLLCEELGNSNRAVLVVTVICALEFVDGKNLSWTVTEKLNFTSSLKSTITDTWSEKHVLRTVTSTALKYDTVGVVFDIQLSETLGWSDHSHYNISVTKVPPNTFLQSATRDPLFTGILNGKVELNSNGLMQWNKGGPEKQIPAAHEFGHMIGYLDEYLNQEGKPEGVDGWTTDQVSIMNLGRTVQPRHYIWFADWCNAKYKSLGGLSRQPIEFKVDGVVNMATAKI